MKILLVSSYELGRQPLGVASLAARLSAEGHSVRAADLSLCALDHEDVVWADRICYSVPMHTAARIALASRKELRRLGHEVPISFYGLYGAVAGDAAGEAGFSGEYESGVTRWIEDPAREPDERLIACLEREKHYLPKREILPSLSSYARMVRGSEERIAGAVEATHGCAHKCRHCPVPAVYRGRVRRLESEVVLADIDQLVAMGALHVTFADADFLNVPRYAMELLDQVHGRHPELTFDVTAKVEHILEYRDLLAEMARSNCIFVTTAVETTNRRILKILAKGHTPEDAREAARLVRESGMFMRPSFMPFTPWTRISDLGEIFGYLADTGLMAATDPVQLTISLLVPPGSLLLGRPEMVEHLGEYQPDALSFKWSREVPDTADLERDMSAIVSRSTEGGDSPGEIMERVRELVVGALATRGAEPGAWADAPIPPPAAYAEVPKMTESWFCCAEPTESQLAMTPASRGSAQSERSAFTDDLSATAIPTRASVSATSPIVSNPSPTVPPPL